MRLLLVEDEHIIRNIVAELLREEGFEVVDVADSDEAVETFRIHDDFDVLLTDIMMPGRLDGLSLAEHARSVQPDIGVVVFSAYANDLMARLRVFDPPAVVLSKPFQLKELVKLVADLADQRSGPPLGL